MKTVCIYHSIDLDGWMSAAIVKHWFEKQLIITNSNIDSITDKIEFIGYNYGQTIPDLSRYDKVIMCDISFPENEMYKLCITKDFIWNDHHASALAIYENIRQSLPNDIYYAKGLRGIQFAACELTWKYFFPNETMPEIVRLLGRYDCFGHKFTKEDEDRRLTLLEYTKSTTRWMTQKEQDELANLNIKLLEEQKVLEFQYGARQCISNYEEAYKELRECQTYFPESGYPTREGEILEVGKGIYKYLCTEAKQVYKNGFEITFENPDWDTINHYPGMPLKLKFICINKERFNPINFGIDYHKEGYDGCACFYYANGMWNFSLYNDNGEVDCSVIAKQYGGGGHKGAAGFKVKDISQIIK